MQSLLCPYSWARVWQWKRELATLTLAAMKFADRRFGNPASSQSYVVRVLVLTGAGVSAESGIPTFRGKAGYWRHIDPTKLATPEAFARDPQLVWDWYRERRQGIRNARPNAAHAAIARLAQCTDDFLLVTQNVDDLHACAGVAAEKMVQIHGDIFVTRCSHSEFCRRDYDQEHEHEHEVRIPTCAKCGAFMRPGVVWFGEQLPRNELERVEKFLGSG